MRCKTLNCKCFKNILFLLSGTLCMVIVLSVYGAKNEDSSTLGWSYMLALGSFVFRSLAYFCVFFLLFNDEDFVKKINPKLSEWIKTVRPCKHICNQ